MEQPKQEQHQLDYMVYYDENGNLNVVWNY